MSGISTKRKNTLGCWVPARGRRMLEFTTLLWSLLWSQASNPSTPPSLSLLLLRSVNTGMKASHHGVRMAAGWVTKYIHPPRLNKCNLDVKFNRRVFLSQVGPLTTPSVTQCLCNHLTFFGSSFFVMPNLVDVSRTAELFATFSNNPVVVCFVGAIFALYLLVVVWARRKDTQDSAKVNHTEDFTCKANVYDRHSKRIKSSFITLGC